jgi:hypothetical protein
MAHVYDRVAKDPTSHQTPHYGFLDGDGDLIFAEPEPRQADDKRDSDLLITVPATLVTPNEGPLSLPDVLKTYLSDPRDRIRLDDLVNRELRVVLYATGPENFSLDPSPVNKETIVDRIARYEQSVRDLTIVTALLSRWGTSDHVPSLARIMTRLADANQQRGGSGAWLGFRWYPLTLLMYSGGIAALSGDNYTTLRALFCAKVGAMQTGRQITRAITASIAGLGDVYEAFKLLPGHERHYAPRSEYLFKTVQPTLDDLFFLGTAYENLFDRFELLYALVYVDIKDPELRDVWGPPGRFGWKYRGNPEHDPFSQLVAEAREGGEQWPPLVAGFFQGSLQRFLSVAEAYRDRFLNRLPWH